jgi:hypothetical protein
MPCYCPDAVFDCIVAASAAPYSATIYATYEFLFVRKGRRAPIKRYTYITLTPPGSQLDEALEVFADEMIDRGYTSDQVSEFADKLAPDLVSCLSQLVFFGGCILTSPAGVEGAARNRIYELENAPKNT